MRRGKDHAVGVKTEGLLAFVIQGDNIYAAASVSLDRDYL